MKRKTLLTGVVLSVVAAVLVEAAAGQAGPGTIGSLTAAVERQTGQTREALALADAIWLPRATGAGLGLAVGSLVGGLVAYRRGTA